MEINLCYTHLHTHRLFKYLFYAQLLEGLFGRHSVILLHAWKLVVSGGITYWEEEDALSSYGSFQFY